MQELFKDITPLRREVGLQYQTLVVDGVETKGWYNLLNPLTEDETSEEYIYQHQVNAQYVEDYFEEDGADHDQMIHALMQEADERLYRAQEQHRLDMLKISELRRRQKKSRMLRIALVDELEDVEEV